MRKILVLAMSGLVAVLTGCQTAGAPSDAESITRGGATLVYDASIDRVTRFGPAGGPNLVHVVGLERAPDPEGDYTFYGGGYSWISPQGGQAGWIDSAGERLEWPPDPAMDIGPCTITGRSDVDFTSISPVLRKGVVEEKKFEMTRGGDLLLTFTLRNVSDAPATVGAWINTAVAGDARIAIRMSDATEVRGWNDETVDRLRSLASAPDADGWAVLDLRAADWEGGGKAWIETSPEIAIWVDGWWFHRRQLVGDPDATLSKYGEGPVATYIQPDSEIIEAELYGPIVTLSPGESHTSRERWTLYRDAGGTSDVLP